MPATCEANESDVGDNVAAAVGTVPLRETTRLEPFVPLTVNVSVTVPGVDPVGGAKVTE